MSIYSALFFSFGIFPVMVSLANGFFHVDLAPWIYGNFILNSLILLAIWCLLFYIVWVVTVRSHSDFHLLTRFLNVVSVVLIATTGYQALRNFSIYHRISQLDLGVSIDQLDSSASLSSFSAINTSLPDIYYIILDGHGRSDIHREFFSYDDSNFIAELQQLGFYVAGESFANYGLTHLSLASSLNMVYLDEIIQQIGADTISYAPMDSLIQNNTTAEYLQNIGYTNVVFASEFSPDAPRPADIFISPPGILNAYQIELVNMTPLRIPLYKSLYDAHRAKIQYTFAKLPEIASNDQPTFTFVHILAPHPPFVFDANGNGVNPTREYNISDGSHFTDVLGKDEYTQGYLEQVQYIDKQTIILVKEILAKSDQAPIIILQGDHGPGSMFDFENLEKSFLPERMAILNAYYFPGQDNSQLYPAITPVNSFRLIMKQFLHAPLTLLPDETFYCTKIQPYNLIKITDRLR